MVSQMLTGRSLSGCKYLVTSNQLAHCAVLNKCPFIQSIVEMVNQIKTKLNAIETKIDILDEKTNNISKKIKP